jgi:hypothetical protein
VWYTGERAGAAEGGRLPGGKVSEGHTARHRLERVVSLAPATDEVDPDEAARPVQKARLERVSNSVRVTLSE